MSKYFYHASIKAEDIHPAKVENITSNNPVRPPDFEGELIIYNGVLFWAYLNPGTQIIEWQTAKGVNSGEVPNNVVLFQKSEVNPSTPPTREGIIHINGLNNQLWISRTSSGGGFQWVKFYDPNLTGSAGLTGEPLTIPKPPYYSCTRGSGNAIKFTNWQIDKEYGFVVRTNVNLYANLIVTIGNNASLSSKYEIATIPSSRFFNATAFFTYQFQQTGVYPFYSGYPYMAFFAAYAGATEANKAPICIEYDSEARVIYLKEIQSTAPPGSGGE